MTSNTLKAIEATKAKLASLEKKAAAEQRKRIVNLHKEAGFATREDLIAALQELGGAPKKRRGRKAKKTARKAAKKAVAKTGAKKRAKRTVITDQLRKNIIAAVKAGEKGTAVAKKFGISIPSLHNIKKAAGLTKSRKK
ncbi:MAG TPA: hypothetical protein DIV79_05635 [Opitutae bacterium]|nr:hypothetical protein [Opitutaceae bacterium]HCR29481.1 hypothetical protein [Opitutae bacterium]